MALWLREWLRVGAAIALLGGLLWLLAERDVGPPALLRSAAWGLVVWIGCGLVWIGLQYGQGHEDAREQWSRGGHGH
jgi:apolipoprotein N-acyltransferase